VRFRLARKQNSGSCKGLLTILLLKKKYSFQINKIVRIFHKLGWDFVAFASPVTKIYHFAAFRAERAKGEILIPLYFCSTLRAVVFFKRLFIHVLLRVRDNVNAMYQFFYEDLQDPHH